MSQKIESYLEEYRLYDPYKENGCDTFERCEYLLNSRFTALIGFRIKDLHLDSITINSFKEQLLKLKELKLKEYKKKYEEQKIPELSDLPEWMEKWQININKLYNEFKTYEPYYENNCKEIKECIYLLDSRYRAIIEWKKAKYADILINSSDKINPIYKYYSDKFEKDLQILKELKIEEYKTKFYKFESDIKTKTESDYNIFFKEQMQLLKEDRMTANAKMQYIADLWRATKHDKALYKDTGTQRYLENSIREHKEKKEQRLQKQKYEETKKQIQDQLHSLVKMPSKLFGRLMSSSTKKDDTKAKINIWSDKIIEMITEFRLLNLEKCKNLDECIENITIIIDIIYSFIENPNIMINHELLASDKYNKRKNKIYENFLQDYKITFTDEELQNPEYLKLLEEYKKIIIVLQNMKLDDCKNYCPQLEKKTGGIKHKTLKSKIDLKKGKRN